MLSLSDLCHGDSLKILHGTDVMIEKRVMDNKQNSSRSIRDIVLMRVVWKFHFTESSSLYVKLELRVVRKFKISENNNLDLKLEFTPRKMKKKKKKIIYV